MQHPAVMSSFPPHRPVWLQYCQSWACSVAFKITMSFFDNAHSVKQRKKSWKKSLTFSLCFIQLSSMKVKYAHIHTLVNTSIIFLILCTLFILFSLFVFCLPLTRYRTSTNPQLPLISGLSWHQQKASIYPQWEPLSLLISPARANTWREHMYYVAFVSVSHSGNEALEMCPCCVMSVCVFQWVTCQMWSVLLQKKT